METKNTVYDIIVVGAGPAGLNSALYALRNGKTVLILEANIVGGQIANSPKIENLPTIKSISGIDFAMQFANQVENWGGEILYENVIGIKKDNNTFVVSTEYASYESKTVIAAVGVTHKHINIPGEKELLGKGVYYCALCDGPFYSNKEVALIGDGNTAMQYALLLSNICSKVYILTWSDKFYGEKTLENSIKARTNIIQIPNAVTTAFEGEIELIAVTYKDLNTQKDNTLQVSAVFVAIGQIPKNDVFKGFADCNDSGYFKPSEDMSTKTPGFFVAGDCTAKSIRQVVTAVSDGAVAAISACKYLDKLEDK